MKVLTLHQPWASLVALGVKTIETRSWSTKYRGPLAIHAGLTYQTLHRDVPEEERALLWASGSQVLIEPKVGNEETWAHGNPFHPLPLGAIVATARLVDVVPMVDESECTSVPGRGRIIAISRTGEYVTGLTWRNTVSPTRYVDKEWCEDIARQRPYGDFTPGRWAWLLADVEPLVEPVPFKGGQGLTKEWTPPA